eukprot:CAMPEP_0197022642 /NCGR_PEP_ID=MMETSP1384-20130603/3452_1 /TAXON_ID=29189 /ORGANISM="Ammonia sp." /LENGTH=628 /DNA_ID=CAMNT_0042450715 /DNA_START=42 /DNA_END=1928 /DNA_ORIENTATION=+
MSNKQTQERSKSNMSESMPLFDLHRKVHRNYTDSNKLGGAPSIVDKYYLSWVDVAIITAVNTINQLIYKSWFVFAAFIDTDYGISFNELSMSLALTQISALPTIFIMPYLNKYKANWLCLGLNLAVQACSMLNSVLPGSIMNLFVLTFARCLISQVLWTYCNSVVFQFMQEQKCHPDGSPLKDEEKWRKNAATTAFMGCWSYATVLFFGFGQLIDVYGFKISLFMSSLVSMAVAVVMFYRLPAISLHDFAEMEKTVNRQQQQQQCSVDEEEEEEEEVDEQVEEETKPKEGALHLLWSAIVTIATDSLALLLMVNLLACVTNWGMIYGSVGIWVHDLYNLNAQQLGLVLTICEASAEFIALFAIPIISKCVANSTLCAIGGSFEVVAVMLLNVLLWNNGEVLNEYVMTLHAEWARITCVMFCIFLFYMGHEFLYVSSWVNLDMIPKKQHSTAVALYGVADFLGAFFGQLFVTYMFTKDGMSVMAPIMLGIEAVSISCLLATRVISHIRKKQKLQKLSDQLDSSDTSIVYGTLMMMKADAVDDDAYFDDNDGYAYDNINHRDVEEEEVEEEEDDEEQDQDDEEGEYDDSNTEEDKVPEYSKSHSTECSDYSDHDDDDDDDEEEDASISQS